MRVFVAGATGAIGARLVPRLVQEGHEVVGTCRSRGKADRLLALGADPVVLDLLDRAAVREAVLAARPDAIVHQATALTGLTDFKHFDRSFAATNALRTRGTDALLAAGEEAGVRRFVVQSYAGWPYARVGGPVKTEDDPLDPTPVPEMSETLAAIEHLESAVVGAGGLALRYGGFYGSPDDAQLDPVRKATVPNRRRRGRRLVVRSSRRRCRGHRARAPTVMMMTESRGASNAKAKSRLGWALRHPSWRDGFPAAYRDVAALAA